MAGIEESRKKPWFGREFYGKRQPFLTLAKTVQGRKRIIEEIRKLTHPTYDKAIEVGPGTMPVITKLPFETKVFLERSQELAEQLKKTLSKHKGRKGAAEIVVGDILTSSAKTPEYNVAVANEVLTHVEPRLREKALKNLASFANNLVIVERIPVEGSLKKMIEKRVKEEKQFFHVSPRAPAEIKRRYRIWLKRVEENAKEAALKYVEAEALAGLLKKLDYRVNLKQIKGKTLTPVRGVYVDVEPSEFENYYILSARRKSSGR